MPRSGGEGTITYYYKHPVYKMVNSKESNGAKKRLFGEYTQKYLMNNLQ